MNQMPPSQLETQSQIKIDEWLEIDSDKWKRLDDTPAFTKKVISYGLEDGWMVINNQGQLYCKWNDKPSVPFHFTLGSKTYGYKMSKRAAN